MSRQKKIDFEIDGNGCFNCISHKPNKDGYRQIVVDKKLYIMHRFIYLQCFGEIPPGFVVRHKCDNTHCINPEHLEIGTPADNTRDRVERGRGNSPNGEKHGRSKLKKHQVREIFEMANKGENLRVIAEKFNVDKSAVFKIKKGLNWGFLNLKMSDEHIRLMEFVLDCIIYERQRQTELYGIQRHDLGKWLAILTEEVGEVAQAMQPMMGLNSGKDTDKDDLFNELIQVAAVAAAIAEQIKEQRGWF